MRFVDRRRFLRASGVVAAGSWAWPTSLTDGSSARRRSVEAESAQWGWPYDVDGDGRISAADRKLVAGAGESARGQRVRGHAGWDPRLDFLARGRLGDDLLARYDEGRPALGTELPPRPIVTCWQYGWYRSGRRRGETPTVRYIGGAYGSADRRAEGDFNALKNEFGISADLLSWIDERRVLDAYARGYLAAGNRDTRLIGLLYESVINLDASGRIDFGPQHPHADKLVRDFRRMGSWLREAAGDGDDGLLLMDGRPVVYVFGSHTFGTARANLPFVGQTLIRARAAFASAFGAPPWLIGDEVLFPHDEEAGFDRLYRAAHFDAIGRYHHYDERQTRQLGDGDDIRLDAAHRRRLADNEERSIRAFSAVRNLFTEAPPVVIPSSAAGFAKVGMPSVRASRGDYLAHLQAMQRLTDRHLAEHHASRLGTDALPAPLALVGSWNEEFEGHALMPSSSNRALVDRENGGFDWLYAIKQLYGVNPYGRGD